MMLLSLISIDRNEISLSVQYQKMRKALRKNMASAGMRFNGSVASYLFIEFRLPAFPTLPV